jgi:hypothetical protein
MGKVASKMSPEAGWVKSECCFLGLLVIIRLTHKENVFGEKDSSLYRFGNGDEEKI